MMNRTARGRAAVSVVIGVAALSTPTLATAAGDDSEPVDSIVTVVDQGDPDGRIVLATPPSVGATAQSELALAIDMDLSAPWSLDVTIDNLLTSSVEVTAVDDDGGFTTSETITAFDQTVTKDGEPTSLEDLDMEGDSFSDFSALVGVPLVGTYETDGELVELEVAPDSAGTHAVDEDLVDVFEQDGLSAVGVNSLLPTEPVGEGAEWTVSGGDDPTGMFELELLFRLVSLEGDTYEIEVSIPDDVFDSLADEAGASGSMELSGTMTGRASDPLYRRLVLDMITDVTTTEDGAASEIDVVAHIDLTSTPT